MSFDIDDINLLIGVYFVRQLYMADDRHFPKSHMYFFCLEFKKFGLMSCIFLLVFFIKINFFFFIKETIFNFYLDIGVNRKEK